MIWDLERSIPPKLKPQRPSSQNALVAVLLIDQAGH